MSKGKNDVTLKRALGFWQSFGVAVGLVVAGTTMVSLNYNFGAIGPGFIIPAGLAGIISILICTSYAELASSIPSAAMIVDYTMPAMGKSMSIFAMLTGYIVLISTAGASECYVAGQCAEYIFGIDYKLFALILLVLFLIINCIGVEALGKSQIILTFGMILILIIFGLGGLFDIGTVGEPHPVEFAPYGWTPIWTGMGAGIWLYIGIEYVCPMAEEVINPQKNIPRAMIGGVTVIFIADMLFGEAAVRYIDLSVLTTSDVPQLEAAKAMFGTVGVFALALATVFAGGSSADSHMAAVPRMIYGLAREGMLPKIFAYIHPKFRTPWIAIFASFACMMVPFFTGLDITKVINFVNIACVAWVVSYIITQVDLIILRQKYPTLHRPFKSPLYPVPQIIGIAACVYIIVTMGMECILPACGFMAAFALYALLWVKFKMKEPCFKPVPIDEMKHIQVEWEN